MRSAIEPAQRMMADCLVAGDAVRDLEILGDSIGARVHVGTRSFWAEWSYDEELQSVETVCDCSSGYEGADPCQHVWALLRAGEAMGLVPPVPSQTIIHWEHYGERGARSFNDAEVDSGVNRQIGGRASSEPPTPPQRGRAPREAMERLLSGGSPGANRLEPQSSWVPRVHAMLSLDRADAGDGLDEAPRLALALVARAADGYVFPMPLDPTYLGTEIDPVAAELLVLAMSRAATSPMESPDRAWRDPGLWGSGNARLSLTASQVASVIPRVLRAERLLATTQGGGTQVLALSEAESAGFRLRLEVDGVHYVLSGALQLGGQTMNREAWQLIHPTGLVVAEQRATVLPPHLVEWAAILHGAGDERLEIAADELEAFLDRFYSLQRRPDLELPAGLAFTEAAIEPSFFIDLGAADGDSRGLPVSVGVMYGERALPLSECRSWAHDMVQRKRYRRDPRREADALGVLDAAGVRSFGETGFERLQYRLGRKRAVGAVQELLKQGWTVSIERQKVQRVKSFRLRAASGIDWLELGGTVELGDEAIPFGELVRALRQRGREGNLIQLENGRMAVIPDEWVRRLSQLSELERASAARRRAGPTKPGARGIARDAGGAAQPGELRSQERGIILPRAFVGATLAVLDSADSSVEDSGLRALRRGLEQGRLPQPCKPPRAFRGELRDYQKEGLGWLKWLSTVGFGGCLADDMGLGKTVQVLALLAGKSKNSKPSLVVAPRSVVHNWADEARRFVPLLSPRVHLGQGRASTAAELNSERLIVTTYATLLRDIELFQGLPLDYLVLDEAQAIKNPASQAAQGVRTLAATHRLALSGTPLENHLGELWSLLDFLNPGFGNRAPVGPPTSSDADRQLVQRLVKPFILRRTKRQVAQDLPERIEQTLTVELTRQERRRYLELHEHFRREYSEAVARLGVQRSTPHLLTGLLRLRQAACHQGLIDPKQRHKASSKLEVLLERLTELHEEGAKCLVFSQFTAHLDIVEQHLTLAGIPFVRLDGATRSRAACVKRFQEDASVSVFLISLKAGGTGLNLTAAEYVFLLDPWWNPAVEAQAIDRAHRIGQRATVVAYRLIAAQTIEEKVAELQAKKRALFESVFEDESAFLGKLSRDELQALLD